MIETLKRLALGLALLALAASVLLYTDRGSRKSARNNSRASGAAAKTVRVALVQHASIPALDEGINGILEALAARGYAEGGRLQIKRYNAEADIGTANAIAKEVTSGGYDLILSASTLSLQTIANANKFGARTRHVFGLVSDPYSAGVGIEATNHSIHPAYMTGYGSIQPVANIFRTARQMRPELKSVGLVWNSAEANSVAQTKIARAVCSDLGLTLAEANADNSTAALAFDDPRVAAETLSALRARPHIAAACIHYINFVVTGSIGDKGDPFPVWRPLRSDIVCINFGEAFLLTGLDVPGKDTGFPGTAGIERDCLSVRRPAALLIVQSHDFLCLRNLILAT